MRNHLEDGSIPRDTQDRYYGVEEVTAERLRDIVEAHIIRMLQVTDITARKEVRRAWDVISNLGKQEEVDSDHVRRVLHLIGGGTPRMPLLGKVWGIINLCEASLRFSPEQADFRQEIWSTLREIIQTEPDQTNVSQMILVGAWAAGLAYPEADDDRATRFQEVIGGIDDTKVHPETRYGMQVAARILAELLEIDQLRLGIFTVEIQGGAKQDQEYRGLDLKKGYPDTIMILREGAIHSEKKLKEGVSLGVPSTGHLMRRPLKVMVGLQRELSQTSGRVSGYPNRRWSFLTPGSYTHSEAKNKGHDGQFSPDGLTLWVALQAVDRVKGEYVSVPEIRSAATGAIRKLQETIRLQMTDGSVQSVPGVLQNAVEEWNVSSGQQVALEEAVAQLAESAMGLIISSSEQDADGEHLLEDRSAVYETYKTALWDSIALEDKLAFAKILFREGSSHWQELGKGSQSVYHLALEPELWDQQTPEQQTEIARALFESAHSQYGKYVSDKQKQIMRRMFDEELASHRRGLVADDVKRVRSVMLAHLRRELVIRSETIRDKAGETAIVVFKDDES